MNCSRFLCRLTLFALIFALAACVPLPTATFEPNDIPPGLLFTPTPDPNAFSISAEIAQGHSQEEITRILFAKWLDHFLSENVSPEMRLDEYTINSIIIPADQRCATKLGVLFIAETEVTAKTTTPSQADLGQYSSRWMLSAGGQISESKTHRTIRFDSAISHLDDDYILNVIMQTPMCD